MKLRSLSFFLVTFLSVLPVGAQVFSPGTALFTLETDHFTIIYPKELQGTATYLQSFAEEVYDEVAQALRVEKNLRLPVVLTAATDRLNGYFAFSPSRIVLYAAPPLQDDFPLAYEDYLRKIFLHELTHAVSLSLRAPVWEFLAQVFSDSISPVQLLAPWSFVEGVTVSQESEKGLGRAVDTPFQAQLKQDYLEGRFQSLSQAGGLTTTRYPFGSHYIYGGLFSRYLRETYGADKYAALWKQLGVGNLFAGFEGVFGVPGVFQEIYGIPPESAWEDFSRALALKTPVVSSLDPLSEDFDQVGGMDADSTQVLWSDSGSLRRLDRLTGQREVLEPLDATVYRLALSEDGKKLLVSQFRAEGLHQMALVRIYNLANRRWEALPFEDRLLEASWLPDGRIVAVEFQGYQKNLVVVGPEGRKVIFSGTHRLVPHLPSSYGEDEVVFLLEEAGKGQIIRQHLSTGERQILDLPDQWNHIRYLSSRAGRLAFSFDAGEGFYRMAVLDTQVLRYQPQLLSGGVQFPVDTGTGVFYRGHFSRGQKVLTYPQGNPVMTLERAEFLWKSYVLEPGDLKSAFDSPSRVPLEGYNPFSWLLRPVVWYPTLTLGADFLPYGAGFWAQWMDPTEAAPYSFGAQYLWNQRFVNSSFSLNLPLNGVTATWDVSDTLAAWRGSTSQEWFRTLRSDLSLSLIHRLLPGTGGVGARFSLGVAVASRNPLSGSMEETPYSWPLGDPWLPFSGVLGWSSVNAGGLGDPPLGRVFQPQGPMGTSFSLGFSGWVSNELAEMPRSQVDAQAGIYLPWLNFRTLVTGATSLHPEVVLGPLGPRLRDGSAFVGSSRLPWWPEFSHRSNLSSNLAVYQTTRLGYAFSTDVPLPFYNFYMRSLELEGGYRSVLVEGAYLPSTFGALTLNLSIARGITHRVVFKTRVEVAKAWDQGDLKLTAYMTPVFE